MNCLTLNNYGSSRSKISISSQSDASIRKFDNSINVLVEIGSNESILNNIHDMKNKFDDLTGNMHISQNHPAYTVLSGHIESALGIMQKTRKSTEDIIDFYNTLKEFREIHNTVRGQ